MLNDPAVFYLLFLAGSFGVGFSAPWQYFYVSESMTWTDAQTYCRTNYIDLVTVVSMEEENKLTALVAAAAPGYSGSVWLGLQRAWSWSTGEPYYGQIPFDGTQPNEGTEGAACATIHSTEGLGDWYCNTGHYFICYDDTTDRHILVQSGLNWTDAEAYCRKHYAYLAIVTNAQDKAETSSLLNGYLYIGLISARWSDDSFFAFRYWTGESSDQESGIMDRCVAMMISNSGKWNHFDCETEMPFICYGATSFQPVSRLYHAVRYLKTWLDAQKYCRMRFTDLATVDSVADAISVMNVVDLSYTGSLWIGLQSEANTGRWCWSMGDEPLNNYFNWALDNPSGSGECVTNMNGLWEDDDCQRLLYFVCYSEGTGYFLVEITETWQGAQSYCRSIDTDLARIRSPWEQNQLNDIVDRWVTVWIGLFLDNGKWSDQWSRAFRNWLSGPPASGTPNCASVVGQTSGQWIPEACDTPYPFVCYGDVDRMSKKQFMRLNVSSGTLNLNDASVRAQILYNIEQKIKAKGMNVKVSWRVTSDGSVFKKT